MTEYELQNTNGGLVTPAGIVALAVGAVYAVILVAAAFWVEVASTSVVWVEE